jgi:hypothetical protein
MKSSSFFVYKASVFLILQEKGAVSRDGLFLLDENIEDKGWMIEENEIWENKVCL